ncbi:DUF4333 domain-containing protein [Gulosibacter molinativorax]|uniref:DUF4333 domain-containing protein n=1 Tax=Gulosibacter molinativorax TaxID=256821 RepID=A0ABT7C522_9MICO|nr:DUF4333 domain-containing protein [Gulosibacter molinativorax]MDJ1369897.1 DUF4333 domain-containing protein [Gulosibacter molinativorax]QUY61866.1 Hypotetical protein [Gulosibacter molinativorax]
MTRTAVTSFAALAVVGLALAGCSSTLTVSESDVEAQAASSLEGQLGFAPEIDCTEGLPGEVGAEITCDLFDQSGARYDVIMTVTNVDGTNVEFDVNVPPGQTGE